MRRSRCCLLEWSVAWREAVCTSWHAPPGRLTSQHLAALTRGTSVATSHRLLSSLLCVAGALTRTIMRTGTGTRRRRSRSVVSTATTTNPTPGLATTTTSAIGSAKTRRSPSAATTATTKSPTTTGVDRRRSLHAAATTVQFPPLPCHANAAQALSSLLPLLLGPALSTDAPYRGMAHPWLIAPRFPLLRRLGL